MQILDAYGHVSLPRFMNAEEILAVMDENGVGQMVLATADTCPDLAEISRAHVAHPDRFRAVGMPLGENPAQIRDGIVAQLQAGFLGIRLPDTLLHEHPGLLDPIGDAGRTAFVVGGEVLGRLAGLLLDFLERHPAAVIAAPHFAGVPSLDNLTHNSAALKLLNHPRFLVIFSRQGGYDPAAVRNWAHHLVSTIGWDRLLFGSEYPVALWRDETYADTLRWIDDVELPAGDADRTRFFHENSRRHLFSRPVGTPAPLADRWCRLDLKKPAPVWLFPRVTIDLPEDAHRRLLVAYHATPVSQRGRYREFIAAVLTAAAHRL